MSMISERNYAVGFRHFLEFLADIVLIFDVFADTKKARRTSYTCIILNFKSIKISEKNYDCFLTPDPPNLEDLLIRVVIVTKENELNSTKFWILKLIRYSKFDINIEHEILRKSMIPISPMT